MILTIKEQRLLLELSKIKYLNHNYEIHSTNKKLLIYNEKSIDELKLISQSINSLLKARQIIDELIFNKTVKENILNTTK